MFKCLTQLTTLLLLEGTDLLSPVVFTEVLSTTPTKEDILNKYLEQKDREMEGERML